MGAEIEIQLDRVAGTGHSEAVPVSGDQVNGRDQLWLLEAISVAATSASHEFRGQATSS
jgi:hypothetical protein